MVLHGIINDEIFNGMKMIKYSVNHWWKFSNPKLAFLTGFLQVIAMFTISLINFAVIANSDSVLDIAKDFTALSIIADFDDFFSEGLIHEKAAEVCENADGIYDGLFKIETTTSRKARGEADMKMEDDPVFAKVMKHRLQAN